MAKIDNPTPKVKVSVVLPAYNEELVIGDTLKTILEQDYHEPFEILVCDNNSTDRTAEIAQQMGARVVIEKRKGTRFAYDTAMRESVGDIILVTNADVKLPKNWISNLVKAYEDPEVVGAGTNVIFYGCPKWVNVFLQTVRGLSPKKGMWGVSLSCRRTAFEKIGGFDHGVNTNEDAIFHLLLEKLGKVAILNDVYVEMDGRRFNHGLLASAREWTKGIGLNSLFIQLNYLFTGEIKSYVQDFGDVRSLIFGQGEQTQVAVIVPTNNHQEYISQLLTTLQTQDFLYKFRIYVLDNFSTDLSLQIARIFPNVHVVTYPKVYNFGQRLQLLLSEIDSPVVAFTTPVATLPDDWLTQVYDEFNKKKKINVLAGPYINRNTRVLTTIANQPLDKLSGNLDFNNFAIDINNAREIMRYKGTLKEVAEYVSRETLNRNLNIHYSMSFRAFYIDSRIGTFISDSTKTIKRTFRKMMKPVTDLME